MSNETIAKAIVYAIREGLNNDHRLSWEDIEANTASILEGYSVPPDDKMNNTRQEIDELKTALNMVDATLNRETARGERLEWERDEARNEALANRWDRDQFAAKWATLNSECHAQNQRANQAEKDNMAACDKVVKLRTFLERKWCSLCSCDIEAVATILEETK